MLAGMPGGQTALAARALLEAGVPANDPVLAPAVEYLAKLKHERTYVVGLQVQVLARADAKKYAKEVQAGADWLLKTAVRKDGRLIGWNYPGTEGADGSNTHFAVMGLHAAAQAGAKVEAGFWRELWALYADAQRDDGGWGYMTSGGGASTSSMTTAGALGLAVATKYDNDRKGADPALEKALAALLGGKLQRGTSAAVELLTAAELGRVLGVTEFKAGQLSRAWYRDGCEKVLKEQQEDGSWKAGAKAGLDGSAPVVTTACGLYLLGPPRR